jgi:hypothetical protein
MTVEGGCWRRSEVGSAGSAPAIEGRIDRGRSSAALPATEQALHLHGHFASPLERGEVRNPPRGCRDGGPIARSMIGELGPPFRVNGLQSHVRFPTLPQCSPNCPPK